MHNDNGCQDVRRKGSIVHIQPSYPLFQVYPPPQLSGCSLDAHGHHATADWNGSSVSACHGSLIYHQVSGKVLMQNDTQACQTQSQGAYPQAFHMQVEHLDTAGQIGIVRGEVCHDLIILISD